jgi:hypothetical protein
MQATFKFQTEDMGKIYKAQILAVVLEISVQLILQIKTASICQAMRSRHTMVTLTM